jgi:hypothetical protein
MSACVCVCVCDRRQAKERGSGILTRSEHRTRVFSVAPREGALSADLQGKGRNYAISQAQPLCAVDGRRRTKRRNSRNT